MCGAADAGLSGLRRTHGVKVGAGDSKTVMAGGAAGTDTSECKSMSDCSSLSGTMPEGQDNDLYPSSLFKKVSYADQGHERP